MPRWLDVTVSAFLGQSYTGTLIASRRNTRWRIVSIPRRHFLAHHNDERVLLPDLEDAVSPPSFVDIHSPHTFLVLCVGVLFPYLPLHAGRQLDESQAHPLRGAEA